MIKALVFDLDGTLVDTLLDLATTTNELLVEYDYPEIDTNKYREFIGNGISKLIERAIKYVNGDLRLHKEIFEKFKIEYNNKCLRHASLYEGIRELLNILKNEKYFLFVNTNKNQEISLIMLNALFPNTFIKIYGDSFDYPRKPDPYILNLIKKDYNLDDEEILMIGDSNVDIFTAHNSNIKAVGCTYGFRGKEELILAKADYLIDKPLDLLKILNY